MPIQDGIGALIKLHCKDPLPEHVWSKDKPRRRRERIKYIESQDNANFSVEIFFVPGQIKFDRSIHWRISIYFEGDRVWTWTVGPLIGAHAVLSMVRTDCITGQS